MAIEQNIKIPKISNLSMFQYYNLLYRSKNNRKFTPQSNRQAVKDFGIVFAILFGIFGLTVMFFTLLL
jgi:hypothetical protein